MKIQRVKQISFFPTKDMFEEVDVQLHGDFGESKADFAAFVPTAESVRSLPVGDIGLQHYDFPDGKDDGRPVPLGRKRGVDIAELSEEIVQQQANVKEQYEDFVQTQQMNAQLKTASNPSNNGNNSAE